MQSQLWKCSQSPTPTMSMSVIGQSLQCQLGQMENLQSAFIEAIGGSNIQHNGYYTQKLLCDVFAFFKPHHNDSIAWIYVSCIGKVKVGVSKAENLPRLQFCRVRCHGAAALMLLLLLLLLLPLWTTSLPCLASCELKNTLDRSKLLSFSLNNPFPLQYISICLFVCSILPPPPCSSSFLNWSLSVFAFLTPALRNHLQVHCRSQVPPKLLKFSPSPTHPCSFSMDMWVFCHI